jgi:hypothetical protein
VSEQTVSASDIDDASSAKQTTDAPGSFPGLEQFLARQAAGAAAGTGQPMKERLVWKAAQVAIGQASLR